MNYLVQKERNGNWFARLRDADGNSWYLNLYGERLKLKRLFSSLSDAETACRRHHKKYVRNMGLKIIVSETGYE